MKCKEVNLVDLKQLAVGEAIMFTIGQKQSKNIVSVIGVMISQDHKTQEILANLYAHKYNCILYSHPSIYDNVCMYVFIYVIIYMYLLSLYNGYQQRKLIRWSEF